MPHRKDRIDFKNGQLDDLAVNKCHFRFERMDEKTVWMRVYRNDEPDIVINVQVNSDGNLDILYDED